MKQREITTFGQIFLVVWIIFCILIIWALNNIPLYKPTIINFDNPRACEKVDDKWLTVSRFKIGQDIYICGNIRLSDSTQRKEIQVRVYEGKRTFNEHEIFYDNVTISSADQAIPVDTYLFPGSYEIQISDGRVVLGAIQIEIVEQ